MSETVHQVRHSAATKPPSHPVSDALNVLNSLGYVVCPAGTIRVDGILVHLRVRNGAVVAEADGVTMPFSLLAQTLKPQVRRSFPPVGVDKNGVPSWARDVDIVPVKERKDMRTA